MIQHFMQGKGEVELRGEETVVMVMRISIGVIRRTARGCVLGVDVLDILPSSASRLVNMPDDVKRRILNHSAHIATSDPDNRNNNNLFAFAAHRIKPDMASSLTSAFSDLALTEFTLDSTNVNTATTATAQSVADSAIATPKKKKKKTGAKKSESLEFTF